MTKNPTHQSTTREIFEQKVHLAAKGISSAKVPDKNAYQYISTNEDSEIQHFSEQLVDPIELHQNIFETDITISESPRENLTKETSSDIEQILEKRTNEHCHGKASNI